MLREPKPDARCEQRELAKKGDVERIRRKRRLAERMGEKQGRGRKGLRKAEEEKKGEKRDLHQISSTSDSEKEGTQNKT